MFFKNLVVYLATSLTSNHPFNMKSKHYFIAVVLLFFGSAAHSQNTPWGTKGNTGMGKNNLFGHKNFNDIRIITDNKVRMFVSGLGKVGIGTTKPTHLFEVHADTTSVSMSLSSKNKSAFSQIVKGATSESAVLSFRVDSIGLWQLGALGNNDFSLNNLSLNKTAMYVNLQNNKVGIGTLFPKAKLDIDGTGNYNLSAFEGDLRIGDDKYRLKMGVDINGGNAGEAYIAAHGGKEVLHLGTASSYQEMLTLNLRNGKALVGIEGDSARFAVLGFTNNSGEAIARFMSKNQLRRISISNSSVFADGDSSSQDITIRSKGFGNLHLVQGQNERLRITEKGDVMVDLLDVNDGKISGGSLRFGGNGNVAIASKRTAGDNQEGLDFYTGGVNVPKVSIAKNGNLGVGTGNNKPDYKLVVSGFDTMPNNKAATIKLENTGKGGTSWYLTSGSKGNKQGEKSFTISDDSTFRFKIDKKGRVAIGTGVNYTTLYHDLQVGRTTGSDIGIGTSEAIQDAGKNWLTVSASWTPKTDNDRILGSASHRWKRIYAASGVVNTSDMRDKENVEPIKYGTSALMKLNPVSYTWKNSDDKEVKLGLIAQDLQKVIPEVVVSSEMEYDEETNTPSLVENSRLGVYYSDLIPVLIKGFQEQVGSTELLQAKNAQLESENTQLKLQMTEVIERLNTIESALSQCCNNYQQGSNKSTGTVIDQNNSGYVMQNQPNPFKIGRAHV